MANNPELLKMPLARDGQKSTIPETTDASTGLFSQQYGWQSINSLPPQAGGKAVKREDFNGAFNLLGGIAFMAQKGFTFNFDDTQDYYAGCVVIDTTDGQKYECIADVTAGGSAPSADSTHWQLAGNNSADIDIWFRQASTVYDNGAIALLLTLPTGWYLECTGTGGTTSASDLVITSPTVGATVTDGTVTWTIREVASTADIPAPVDISGKANVDLDNLSAAGLAVIQQNGGIVAMSLTQNGYVKFANGLIVQWGYYASESVDYAQKTVTFPIEFASSCWSVQITGVSTYGGTTGMNGLSVSSVTKTSFVAHPQTSNITSGYYYIAIGM